MFSSSRLRIAYPLSGGQLLRSMVAAVFAVMAINHAMAGGADKKAALLSARVHVKVDAFRNDRGALGCLLFSDAAAFPDDVSKSVGQSMSLITSNRTAECDFENLSPGDYAVVVMHDENRNAAFDKNLFGVPAEGYGASNNHLPAMSSPKWETSHFNIGPGETKILAIQLRYF